MVTARRIVAAALLGLMATLAACSREQQDWRTAEGKDSTEAYGQFIERHPDSELVKEARARIAQLAEDRDWSDAAKADTAAAYQLFLTQHPAGKWAQEARIRVQNFSLAAAGGDLAGAGAADTGPPAGSVPAAGAPESGAPAVPGPGAVANTTPVLAAASGPNTVTTPRAVPGESAVPAGRVTPAGSPASPATAASAASSPPAPGGTLPAASVAPGPTATLSAASVAPAPTTTPAVAGTTASTTHNIYGIQLGAFTSEDRANSEWRALQARFAPQLQGLAPQVVAAETASGRVFRLQALGGDEARARLICEQLRERSQGCVPVIPH